MKKKGAPPPWLAKAAKDRLEAKDKKGKKKPNKKFMADK